MAKWRRQHWGAFAAAQLQTGDHKGEVIEYAEQHSFVLGDKGFHPYHMDTIDLLNLVLAIAIPGIDFALREVGSTGEDSDPMSLVYPVTGMFIDPTGWGIALWQEIIGEKKGMHAYITRLLTAVPH